MTPARRTSGVLVILAMTLVMAACTGGTGVGIGVAAPAAYWVAYTGPGVFVGGPMYR